MEGAGAGLSFATRSHAAVANADVPLFKILPGKSKNTARVYRAVWIQLLSYAEFRKVEPLSITYVQLGEFLTADGPLRDVRLCALRAVFAAHGKSLPVPEVDAVTLGARLGALILSLLPAPDMATLYGLSDEELIAVVRGAVSKKKAKKEA